MRADGLIPGGEFFVVQLFDQEGYYTSVLAPSLDEVREKAAARSARVKALVACTLPFPGRWSGPDLPDVTAPFPLGFKTRGGDE